MKDKLMNILTYVIIILFIVVFPLICGIYFLCQHWKTVDIFSCEKAERAAAEYLSEYHPNADFEIKSSNRGDKSELYYVHISSPSSQDSHFTLGYSIKGKLVYNSYEDRVLKSGNTAIRLSDAYGREIDVLLDQEFETATIACSASLSWSYSDYQPIEPYDIIADELELDADYDLSQLGAKSGILKIWVDMKTADLVTVENMAQIMRYVRKTLDEAGRPGYLINCTLDCRDGSDRPRLAVYNFLYEDIDGEDLEARLSEVAIHS